MRLEVMGRVMGLCCQFDLTLKVNACHMTE